MGMDLNLGFLDKIADALESKVADGEQYLADSQDSQKESSLHFQGHQPKHQGPGFSLFNGSGKHLRTSVHQTPTISMRQRISRVSGNQPGMSNLQSGNYRYSPLKTQQSPTGSPSLDQQLYNSSSNSGFSGSNAVSNNMFGRFVGGALGMLSRIGGNRSAAGNFGGIFGQIQSAVGGTGEKTEGEVEKKEVVQSLQEIKEILKHIDSELKHNKPANLQDLKNRMSGNDDSAAGGGVGSLMEALAPLMALLGVIGAAKVGSGAAGAVTRVVTGVTDFMKNLPKNANQERIDIASKLEGFKDEALSKGGKEINNFRARVFAKGGQAEKFFQGKVTDLINGGAHDAQTVESMANDLISGKPLVSAANRLGALGSRLGRFAANSALRPLQHIAGGASMLVLGKSGIEGYKGVYDLRHGSHYKGTGELMQSVGNLLEGGGDAIFDNAANLTSHVPLVGRMASVPLRLMGKVMRTPFGKLAGSEVTGGMYLTGHALTQAGEATSLLDSKAGQKENPFDIFHSAKNAKVQHAREGVKDAVGVGVGAAAGAAIGSLFFGVGAVPGAIVGGLAAGGIENLWHRFHANNQSSVSAGKVSAAARQVHVSHQENHNNTYHFQFNGVPIANQTDIKAAVNKAMQQQIQRDKMKQKSQEKYSNTGISDLVQTMPTLGAILPTL